MFDRDAIMAHAAATKRAAEMTGLVCTADEEQQASEEFMAWAQSLGLHASFMRALDAGRVVWWLNVYTERGDLRGVTTDPREWRQEIAALGLADTLPGLTVVQHPPA